MKNKEASIKKGFIALLTILAVAATSLAVVFMVSAAEPEFKLGEFKSSYTRGEVLTVPDGRAVYEGSEFLLQHSVLYPDGRISKYDTVFLDVAGTYAVVYSFTAGSQSFSQVREIEVDSKTSSLFKSINNASFTADVDGPDYADGEYNGVGVRLTGGSASFMYDGVLDLRDFAKNQTIFEYLVTPETSGTPEFLEFKLKLTDVYDEDIFMEINIRSSSRHLSSNHASYATVRTDTIADFKGIQHGTVDAQGNPDTRVTHAGMSYHSGFHGKIPGYNCLTGKFYYDTGENALYVSPLNGILDRQSRILDFDDPVLVGSGDVWGGFTTGEVYLTVTVPQLLSGSASMLITSIGGVSLAGESVPASRPQISIDYLGQDEMSLPKGVAGENYSYPVFPAIAYDFTNGKISNIDVHVLYGASRQLIPVVNGRFPTKNSGEYTVLYSARDNKGALLAQKEIKITVLDAYQNAIGYNISDRIVSDASAGEIVYIYDGTAFGGEGGLTVETQLLYRGIAIPVTDEGMEKFFIPEADGLYVLRYTVSDFVGGIAVFEKEIQVTYSQKPVLRTVSLAKEAIVNRDYMLPEATAVLYLSSGKIQVPVKAYVDGIEITDGKYKPAEAGSFTVKYATDGSLGEAAEFEQTVTVKTLNDPIYVANFLYLKGMTAAYITPEQGAKYYGLTLKQEDNYAEYILPVTAKSFSASVSVGSTKNSFDEIVFNLRDSVCADINVELSIRKMTVDGKIVGMLFINGKQSAVMAGSYTGESRTPFSLSYNYKTHELTDYDGNTVGRIGATASGEAFNGFTSGSLYFGLRVRGVTEGEDELRLDSICNQSFLNAERDTTPPVIIFDEAVPAQAKYSLGQTATVYAATAFDMLGTGATLTVRVTQPGGGSPIYQGPCDKNYTFTTAKYGVYSVLYTAFDDAGNKAEFRCNIDVLDDKPPQIEVSAPKSSIKAGSTVTFAKATLTDNYDENPKVMILIIDSYSYSAIVKEDKEEYKYKFDKKGVYKVQYLAYDANGNFAVKEFTVTVE